MTRKFYRVSHRTHKGYDSPYFVGPYGFHGCEWDECPIEIANMGGRHSGVPTHPSPYRDSFDREVWREWADWNCGFDSLEALNTWFDGFFPQLRECGYVVREFNVPDDQMVVGIQALVSQVFHNMRALKVHEITQYGVVIPS